MIKFGKGMQKKWVLTGILSVIILCYILWIGMQKSLHQQLKTHVVNVAERYLKMSRKIESQGNFLYVSRTYIKRINYLTKAFEITRRVEFATTATQYMTDAATMQDWNNQHFLDTAEMIAAISIGLDRLEGHMEASALAKIEQGLIDNGLSLAQQEAYQFHRNSNWNQVVHSALIMGALAADEREHVDNYTRHLQQTQNLYTSDGRYLEGPCYWRYGTLFQVLAIDSLRSKGFAYEQLLDKKLFESARYYVEMTSNQGNLFNYSDCNQTGEVSAALYWLAYEQNQPHLVWFEQFKLARYLQNPKPAREESNRFLPHILDWWIYASEEPATAPVVRRISEVLSYRNSSHYDDYYYVAVRGGRPSAPHGQMDTGSFIFEKEGIRWFTDLGMQNYQNTRRFGLDIWDYAQDSDRWQIYLNSNFSHNTFYPSATLHGVDQVSEVQIAQTAKGVEFNVNMTGVLGACCTVANRKLWTTHTGKLSITDTVKQTGVAQFTWNFVTPAVVEKVTECCFVLRYEGRRAVLKVRTPAGVKLTSSSLLGVVDEHDVVRDRYTNLQIHIDKPEVEFKIEMAFFEF